MLRPIGEVLSDAFVWRSDVCLSRTSGITREQRGPGRPKLVHTGSPRHTWLGHHFQGQKVKDQVHRGRGHIAAASHLQLVHLSGGYNYDTTSIRRDSTVFQRVIEVVTNIYYLTSTANIVLVFRFIRHRSAVMDPRSLLLTLNVCWNIGEDTRWKHVTLSAVSRKLYGALRRSTFAFWRPW